MWWHPWCPHPWRLAGWSSYGLWVPCGDVSHGVDALILLISLTLMPLMRKLMQNFCHFWIHDLMRAKATEVGPPITLIVSDLDPSLAVAPNPHYWCTGWGPSLGTSHHSAAAMKFAGHGDKSWLWRLNDVDAVGMEQGWPGPLGAVCPSVMAWVISHQPSPRLTGLHWVGLACQASWWLLTTWMWCLTPHPSSVLLLTTTTCRTGWPNLGQSLWLLLGQLCHLEPCLPQLVPSMNEVVVVSLSHVWWRPPVFPNNT